MQTTPRKTIIIAVLALAILSIASFGASVDAQDGQDDTYDSSEPKTAESEATVNGVGYTFDAAMNVANGTNSIIYMNWDRASIVVPEGYDVVIDLNGHDVIPSGSGIPISNSGTLTLLNIGAEQSAIGSENTETAILNAGSLIIDPTAEAGGIQINGSVCNDDNDGVGQQRSIQIVGDVSVTGHGNSPALGSSSPNSVLMVRGGTFTHSGGHPLIEVTGGSIHLNGGTFTAAESQPVLSYRNDHTDNSLSISIGTVDGGPTISGATSEGTALFEDTNFGNNGVVGYLQIIMDNGTITQNGDGGVFRCGVDLNGGTITRSAEGSDPIVDSDYYLDLGIQITGSSSGPLVRCVSEFQFSENGSIVQTGSGYALECGSFYTGCGEVTAVNDAVLTHGHIEINGDGTKPVITSENGYCFVANYGSFEGGRYSFGSDANLIRLGTTPGEGTSVGFDENVSVNGKPISEMTGPLTDADGIEPTEHRYMVSNGTDEVLMSVYIFDLGGWVYDESRQTQATDFDSVFGVSLDTEGMIFFESLDDAVTLFPDSEGMRSFTLMKDVTLTEVTVSDSLTLNLNGYNVSSLVVAEGSSLTVEGDGTVVSVNNRGHLTINGGTYSGTIQSAGTLAVNGGTFATVPSGATLAEGHMFVQQGSMWVVVPEPVIKVDGTEYPFYKDAMENMRNGSEVTLLKDGTGSLVIPDGLSNVVIDMNGFAITSDTSEALTIGRGTSVTIVDDDPSSTGTTLINGGDLTITGGTFGTVINFGTGAKNMLTIKGGTFLGDVTGGIPASLIIGDPDGASTVRITGGTFEGSVISWDVYPGDNRTPKVYIAGGTFHGAMIGLMGDPDTVQIGPADAGFMISGGRFSEITEEALQAGYIVELSDGMQAVVMDRTGQTSIVTFEGDLADKEVIIELPNQTIVSNGGDVAIPVLEDGYQNMTVEVDGKKFTTVVEVSNGVIVNEVDLTVPKGSSTVDSQGVETDESLSKAVVGNINSIFDDIDEDEDVSVEVVLSLGKADTTSEIERESGGKASITVDITINTTVGNTTTNKSELSNVLEFIIPVPEEDLGKAIQVYRGHDGVVSALPELDSRVGVTTEGYLVENGYIHIFAQRFSTYTAVTTEGAVADDDDVWFPPSWDDDDYVPVQPQPVPEESGDNDTVTIVACAAAAVVAALMAAFLIIDRRH